MIVSGCILASRPNAGPFRVKPPGNEGGWWRSAQTIEDKKCHHIAMSRFEDR